MAITDSFDLNQALNSPSYAYKCYYNYKLGADGTGRNKNTMGISDNDMRQIELRWGYLKGDWDARIEADENRYEIDDTDWNNAVDDGKDHASEVSEHDGSADTTRTVVGSTGAIVGGVGGAAAGTAAAITASSAAAASTASTAAASAASTAVAAEAGTLPVGVTSYATGQLQVAAGQAADKAAAAASKAKLSVWLSLAASIILVAVATWMKAAHFNKDQVEAAQKLQAEQVENSQTALNAEQGNMADYAQQLEEKAAEAEDLNTETNDQIADKKKEHDAYVQEYMTIMEKLESGEPLTDEDKERLKELIGFMEELGVDIEDLSDETQDSTEDIYSEMEGYQDKFDASAETMANVQGVTEFAAGFDEKTVKNCDAVIVSGSIGVAGAGITMAGAALGMAKAAGKGVFGIAEWIAGGVALAGAATAGTLFGMVIKEQKDFKNTVKEEIDVRHVTEELNTETHEQYDERIDDFGGYVGTVEDLEILIPDDMEVPDEPPETTSTTGNGEAAPNPYMPNSGQQAPTNPYAPNAGNNPYMPNSGQGENNPYSSGNGNEGSNPFGAPTVTSPTQNQTPPVITPDPRTGNDADKDPDKDKDKEV